MMMTSRAFMALLFVGGSVRRSRRSPRSGIALGPTEPADDQEDSAEREPRRPDVALLDDRRPAGRRRSMRRNSAGNAMSAASRPKTTIAGDRVRGLDRAVAQHGDVLARSASAASVVQSLMSSSSGVPGPPGRAAYMPGVRSSPAGRGRAPLRRGQRLPADEPAVRRDDYEHAARCSAGTPAPRHGSVRPSRPHAGRVPW